MPFDKNGVLMTYSSFLSQLVQIGLLNANQQSVLNIKLLDPGTNLLNKVKPISELKSKQQLTRMAQSAVEGRAGMNIPNILGFKNFELRKLSNIWYFSQL